MSPGIDDVLYARRMHEHWENVCKETNFRYNMGKLPQEALEFALDMESWWFSQLLELAYSKGGPPV